MSVDEQIQQILEETKTRIQRRMAEEGINATGRTSLSLRVVRDGTRVSLIGGGDSSQWGGKTAPFESVELGRAPGGNWKVLRPIIVQWTIDKGLDINAETPQKEESIRWAISTIIAKNIVANGTRRYNQPVDVYSTPVKEGADKIRKIVGADLRQFMKEIVAGRTIETNTNF